MKFKTILGLSALVVLALVTFVATAHAFDPHFLANLLTPEGAIGALTATAAPAVLPEAIKAELDRINGQVTDFLAKFKSEIEDGAKLAKGAKETADEILSKQGELRERLQDTEQKLASMESRGGDLQAKEDAGSAFERYMDENEDRKSVV